MAGLVLEVSVSYSAASLMNATVRPQRLWSRDRVGEFDGLRSPRGALVVDSPQEVNETTLFQYEILAHQRFLA